MISLQQKAEKKRKQNGVCAFEIGIHQNNARNVISCEVRGWAYISWCVTYRVGEPLKVYQIFNLKKILD